MDRWEYTSYVAEVYGGIKLANDQKLNWVEMWEHFNQLGRQGWEMLSATPIAEFKLLTPNGVTTSMLFVFRRRIA